MKGARPRPRLAFGASIVPGERVLPEEVGVALTFNGTTQAVMMATPDHLEDFAYGFALTEGLARPDEIESIETVATDRGIDLQLWVTPAAEKRLADRRRVMAGPVGCGLCGIDSLEQALRPMSPVGPGGLRLDPSQIRAAVAALPGTQPLHDATRAAHAAGFWDGARMVAVREDVGRHNALDKLAGALVRASTTPPPGAVVMTSRVSIDLVQKVAALGAPMLVAVSAPTADAVDLAERLGITLIARARADGFELYTHSDRIETRESHVR
ncbi:MAG: formate dehydrogenase accessory sulfurtransferase FdhD [Rhodobacteraceae bacterium]|nr:formate dehydrogenase accessory sulfurtransferase FdhD [Paracoccaceae bacterium]